MALMDDDFPATQPGRLIEQARDRIGMSQNEAADRLGMSGTRWRQIVKGEAVSMTSKRGVARLARMAQLVGVPPDGLDAVGRADIAEELRRVLAGEESAEAAGGPSAAEIAELRKAIAALEEETAALRDEVKALKAESSSETPDATDEPGIDHG